MSKSWVLLLFLCIFLVSCTTNGGSESAFTEEEAQYALHYAIKEAENSSLSKLYLALTNEATFIPVNSPLEQNRFNIPGMDTLLNDWTETIREQTLLVFENFVLVVKPMFDALEFTNAVDKVSESNSSISSFFQTLHKEQIHDTIQQGFTELLDDSKWKKAEKFYQAWIVTNSNIDNLKTSTNFAETDIKTYLTDFYTDLFFSLLSNEEEQFRTTPDPYADPVVAKVFNLV